MECAVNEATIRRELYQMLRYRYNLWPDHFPDIAAVKQPGRPDLVVMNPKGPGYYVEVKAFAPDKETAFPFSCITEGQRKWLTMWNDQCDNVAGSWLAIGAYGTRHEIYLIPWADWLGYEDLLSPYQNSLPYKVGHGYDTEMQRLKIDFRMLEWAKLLRVPTKERLPGESGWRIPPQWEAMWISN